VIRKPVPSSRRVTAQSQRGPLPRVEQLDVRVHTAPAHTLRLREDFPTSVSRARSAGCSHVTMNAPVRTRAGRRDAERRANFEQEVSRHCLTPVRQPAGAASPPGTRGGVSVHSHAVRGVLIPSCYHAIMISRGQVRVRPREPRRTVCVCPDRAFLYGQTRPALPESCPAGGLIPCDMARPVRQLGRTKPHPVLGPAGLRPYPVVDDLRGAVSP
jgi:hypothetical protein